jgi:hypothetical protein
MVHTAKEKEIEKLLNDLREFMRKIIQDRIKEN